MTKCLTTASAVIVSAPYIQANNYLFIYYYYAQAQHNKEVHTKIQGYKTYFRQRL